MKTTKKNIFPTWGKLPMVMWGPIKCVKWKFFDPHPHVDHPKSPGSKFLQDELPVLLDVQQAIEPGSPVVVPVKRAAGR